MRWIAVVVATMALGCESATPPGDDSTSVEANPETKPVAIDIQSPTSIIAFPGSGLANVRLTGVEGVVKEQITPTLTTTGPFTARWESLRWQLRTLSFTATDTGSGMVTVSMNGRSTSFLVTATRVDFKRVGIASASTVATQVINGCGIALDDKVWCWGGNRSGQLGAVTPYHCQGGSCQYSGVYPSQSPLPVSSQLSFTQVAVTSYSCFDYSVESCGSSCALTVAGAAWCWGNGFGDPVWVAPELTFTSLAVGGDFGSSRSCGLTADGSAYCFTKTTTEPVSGGLTFKSIAVGSSHRCGVTKAGDVWCWGGNSNGALGIGNADGANYAAPQRVTTGGGFVAVDAGKNQTCALGTDGVIRCWGATFYAVDSSPPPSCASRCQTTPKALEGGRTYVSIAMPAFGLGVCGLTASGAVDCWSAFNQPPRSMSILEPFVSLAHGCAMTATNAIWCWWDATGNTAKFR
jgi:hypothetical protein